MVVTSIVVYDLQHSVFSFSKSDICAVKVVKVSSLLACVFFKLLSVSQLFSQCVISM